jgi:hypothetical protein
MESTSHVLAKHSHDLSNHDTSTSKAPIVINDPSTLTLHIPTNSSSATYNSSWYPTLESILAVIDAEGSFEAVLDFPVVIFGDNLREWGLVTADDLTAVNPDFLTSVDIGMTQGLWDHVFQLAFEGRKATKGKDKCT